MLLAIDSSSLTASAALVHDGVLIAEGFLNTGLKHSQTLAPLIDCVLRGAGTSPSNLTRIAVTNGPGSFTGLRIGAATAIGLASALGIPCDGVSSLMAAAYSALGTDGTVCAVMDARRDQYYSAMFRSESGRLTRLTPDTAAGRDQLLAGLPDEPVLWCGDAASQCARSIDRVANRAFISGYGTALCCLNGGENRPADRIVYLRLPQAERERIAKGLNEGVNPPD